MPERCLMTAKMHNLIRLLVSSAEALSRIVAVFLALLVPLGADYPGRVGAGAVPDKFYRINEH